MRGSALREARRRRAWTQQQAARRLGVSQGYLSLLERGRRRVPPKLVRKLHRHVDLPPTEWPVTGPSHDLTAAQLGEGLTTLGYPGFAYLPARTRLNPAQLLQSALRTSNLETRLVEALPWVLLRYPDLDWEWLLRHTKLLDLQNRLGLLVTLARELAERRGDAATAAQLARKQRQLEHCRLAREDTLCRESMTAAERRWLRTHRSAEAAHWNLLTDLAPDHLPHAG